MFVIKTKKPVVVLLRQDNGQRTTDNGQRRAKPAHSSQLTAFLYLFYLLYPSIPSIPFRLLPLALSLLSDSEAPAAATRRLVDS